MPLQDNCSNLRVINVDASSGCSLTRASIRGMTPADFEAQDVKEVGMDKVIARAQEARMAGVVENTLEDLLFSRFANIKGALQKAQIGQSESVILPYIYRRQKRNINSNYFLVESGAANPGAGSNGLPASSWDLTVKQNNSPFSSNLVGLDKYFLTGKTVIVEWFDSTTKVSYTTQGKVVAVADASSGGVNKAKVTIEPNVTAGTWAGYNSTQKAPYQPTTGILIIAANSISDYESWCQNEVAENTNKLLAFWLQTSRETHEYSDEYLKALNAALTSNYWKSFRQLPLAEQKRVQHMKYMRSLINSIFYGRRINEKQGVETYTQLPQVVDPLNPSCVLEYKANALGFMTQLEDCNRVWDSASGNAYNPINLETIAQYAYEVKRAREASGGTIDTIDLMTDRWTAGGIHEVLNKYYKDRYGTVQNINYQPNQALKFEERVMLRYNLFQLPEDLGGINLAVFSHEFFDDRLSAFGAPSGISPATTDLANRGRALWMIDWSDIQWGVAATASVNRQTNVADDLYNCVIKPNIHHYMLNSMTWTGIMEDPNRHWIFRNFNSSRPYLRVNGTQV